MPGSEPEWVHNDGTPCADWSRCDTYEHHRPDGTETITKIKARPLIHSDGSECTYRRRDECPLIYHFNSEDERAAHESAVQHPTPFEEAMSLVEEVIDGRVDVYGDPAKVFVRHAQVWSGILGIEVQPWQVALCMIGYKLVRTGITPDYSDNSDDIEGYLDIFRQLMPDMVQARDTAEYLTGGGQGARA